MSDPSKIDTVQQSNLVAVLTEVPASVEKVQSVLDRYADLSTSLEQVLKLLNKGLYAAAMPDDAHKWITNVFQFVAALNEYTHTLVFQMTEALQKAYAGMDHSQPQAGGVTEATVDLLLKAGISSFTPNIIETDYFSNQHNGDFYPSMLQNNSEIVMMAYAVAIHYFRRDPSLSFANMSDDEILELLQCVTGHQVLDDLRQSAQNYIGKFRSMGYDDLLMLKELNDHLEVAFTVMRQVMSSTMGPYSSDLFNNIYALQAGILSMIGEEMIDLIPAYTELNSVDLPVEGGWNIEAEVNQNLES